MPKDKDVVIKVIVSGTNPKDWKHPFWKDLCLNSGDDIAGIVHSIGKDLRRILRGSRLDDFPYPPKISFEEAATIPTPALTAVMALYVDMRLPAPFDPRKPVEGDKVPILIYSVTSAVGAFAAKFARLSGLSPIIGVAGRAGDFAKTVADYFIDYRDGEDAFVASVEEILAKEGLGISENGSLEATLRVIDHNGGAISTLLPPKLFAKDGDKFKYPDGVTATNTAVPRVFSTHKNFGYLWSRYLGRLLEDGRLKPHPYEVIPGGLKGALTGLRNLKSGKASAVKYVYRIEETGDITTGLQTADEPSIGESAGLETHQSARKFKNFPFPD
ncbi:putative alcohol dehydrogenase [Hypoxylon sp. FL0543]|nr:putative alcohol dehydrogenase [Hypoxylon sp. FL0543]